MKLIKKVLGATISVAMLVASVPAQTVLAADVVASESTTVQYTNIDYSADFSNDTGADIVLSQTTFVNDKATNPEPYISTDGKLTIKPESGYSGLSAVIYNPAYYWSANRYNVTIDAKNLLSATSQYLTVYLNYQNSKNYYAVKISGSKYENGAYVHKSYVKIQKCVNGVVTDLCDEVPDAISKGDFVADIQIVDNVISVYEGTKLVAYAMDNGEVLEGGYVAFGTESSQAAIDSVEVTMLAEDKDFSEDFSEADLSDGNWVGVVDGKASISTNKYADGNALVLTNGQSTVMYNKNWSVYKNQYELTYEVYNGWGGKTQYIKTYFNYRNADNHYYIAFGGGSYISGAGYTDRNLAVGRVLNGVKTEEVITLSKAVNPHSIKLVSDKDVIKVYANEILVYETEDTMNQILGGYIGFSANSSGFIDDVALTHFDEDKEYSQNFDANVEVPEGWVFYPGSGQTISAASGALAIGAKGTYLSGKAVYEGQKYRYGNYILSFTGTVHASGTNSMNILFNYTSDSEGYKIAISGQEAEPKLYKNGTKVEATSTAIKGSSTNNYRLIYNNGNITLFANGMKYLEYTDAEPVNAGYIGFGSGAAPVTIDNVDVSIPNAVVDTEGNSYIGEFSDDTMGYWMSSVASKSAYLQSGKLVFGTWSELQNCTMYFLGRAFGGSYVFDTKNYYVSGANTSSKGTILFNIKNADNYYRLDVQSGDDGKFVLYKSTEGALTQLAESENIVSTSITRDIRIEYRAGGQIIVNAAGKELINCLDAAPIESGYIGYGATNSPVSVGGFEMSLPEISVDDAHAYDGETEVASLAGLSGKSVTIKKRIINNTDEEKTVIPVAAIKDNNGALHALAIGESTIIPDSIQGDPITATVTVPENADKMDLYLYLWESIDTLKPSEFDPECVVVGEMQNLFIMGDSMCASYGTHTPQEGWGFFLKDEFDGHINATNFAVGGYRTSSVLDDTKKNNWTQIKAQIKEGDYVLMGLGYNDRHDDEYEENNRLTTEEYQNNLRLLYDECTALGATMIFVTPATDLWHYEQGVGMKNCGAHIALEMKEVAEEKNAVCLDLNTALWNSFVEISSTTSLNEAKDAYYLSKNYLAGLGIDTSTVTWNSTVKNSGQDLVHFNDDGAQHLSNLIKGLLADSGLPIARFLK